MVKRKQRIPCAVLFLFFVLSSVTAEVKNQELWNSAPDLPYRVQEIYPTLFNQYLVVAGGLSPDIDENPISVSDRVLAYSLEEKKWIEGPSLPEPRHHPMLVNVGNRLFSFGGFTVDENGIWHNSTDVLELVVDSSVSQQNIFVAGRWEKIANMPAPLAETLSAVNGVSVHLMSGRTPTETNKNSQWNEQTDVSTHYIFDTNSMSWSRGKNVPTARNSACSVQTKAHVYTVAGRTVEGGNLGSHEAYNFSTKQWDILAPLPEPQGGLACSLYNNRIYVFGGEYFENGGGVYSDVWEYDIANNTWQSVTQMPDPRHGLGAVAIDNKIYVIAGALQAGGNQTSANMTVFLPENLSDK